MKEAIYDQLLTLASVCHWFGRYDEMHALSMLGRWLRENGIRDREELADFIATSNDNPNTTPLTDEVLDSMARGIIEENRPIPDGEDE